jgi:hypothetical protein
MKRAVWFAMAAVLGWMLAGESVGWGAPRHGAHPVAKKAHPPKPKAPKHGGGKTAPHPKKEKGTAEKANKNEAAKPGDPKHEAGKETKHEVHKPDAMASQDLDRAHDHLDDLHHHRHGVNGVNGVVDGGGDAVVPGDAGPLESGGPVRPQIHFRVQDSERDAYDSAAKAAGISRAEWIRSRLNAAVANERR